MEGLPSPFTLLGGAIGAVASMLAGSTLGNKGTLLGAAAGSIITAVVSTAVEHNSKKMHERLKGPELPDKPVHSDMTLYVRDLQEIRRRGEARRKARRWQLALMFAVMLVVPLVAAFSVMSVVEASTGSTVKGFTVWQPSPAVTRTVTPPPDVVTVTPTVTRSAPVTPSTTPSASVTVTLTASPDSSPSSFGASPTVTPSLTDTPSAGTPESTPTVGNPP